jgi:hypothetical protein
MAAYRRGSKGDEVAKIQTRLRSLGVYRGPIDGDFGGGTESAIRTFQAGRGLVVDGEVGPETWRALFDGAPITPPAILSKPLTHRALALSAAFETDTSPPECFAGLTGNFDDQGISFGACQWNLGQGSLQVLLTKLDHTHPTVIDAVFGPQAVELRTMLSSPREKQLAWARSIQNPRSMIAEPWRGLFKTLGRCDECQDAQVQMARSMYEEALAWCRTFGVSTERAVALMFDIRVQNGSIREATRALIVRDFQTLDRRHPDHEVERLRVIANRRAEAADPRWVDDVRTRKLTIANGVGTVHGAHVDLEAQYGIGLKPVLG